MATYVFIDSRIDTIAALLAGLAPGTRVVVLDATQNGTAQIAQALQGVTDVDAVHIVSHGADGVLYLGDSALTSDNLDSYAGELTNIGASLTATGDILLYGCEVAASEKGQRFIERLSELTSADVAASNDATGAAVLGGNWLLETQTGVIDSAILSAGNYRGLLDMIVGDNDPNHLVGTAGNDPMAGLGGNDTIDGGAGFDVAFYVGASSGYRFSLNAGNFVVTDTNPGNGDEGADTLLNIEDAQFVDGAVRFGLEDSEFLVNSLIATDQFQPQVAALADGGFVVSWMSRLPAGNDFGLYAQRYDAGAVALGAEHRVSTSPIYRNQFTENFKPDSAITALADGGYVMTWQNDRRDASGLSDVYVQRYDAQGVAQGGEYLVNTSGTFRSDPAIDALTDGGFVVAWNSDSVSIRRFSSEGVALGPEIAVTANVRLDENYPAISTLTDGGFVVVWSSSFEINPANLVAQRYDAAGQAQGGAFSVSGILARLGSIGSTHPSIAALPDGGFVVAWEFRESDADIYMRRFDASGVAQGIAVRANTTLTGAQAEPAVTVLTEGGFVVSWQSNGQDGSGYGVYAQRYDAAGTAQGGEFLVTTYTRDNQINPAITALADGGFVVTWQSLGQDGSGYGIYARRFDAAGHAVETIPTLTGDDSDNTIAWSGAQGAVIDGGLGADTLSGGSGNDTYITDGLDTLIESDGGGFDTVVSSAQHYQLGDYLENLLLSGLANINGSGNALENDIVGNAGNNILAGGAGADDLRGDAGSDTADYGDADRAVNVELWKGTATEDGHGSTDRLSGIENVIGSAFNDTLVGDGNNNIFTGGAGYDGLFGGAGSDTADYGNAAGRVWAELWLNQTRDDGLGANDFLSSIENLSGSAYDDTLMGDGGNNVLNGRAGYDGLYGGPGNDTADYSDAAGGVFAELWRAQTRADGNGTADFLNSIENLRGSAFDDVLVGDGGVNVLNGGAGNDELYGGAGNDTADYAGAIGGVRVELWKSQAGNDGWGTSDYLNSIENLYGSAFDDTLVGDAQNNVFRGGAGYDGLFGGDGVDTVDYSDAPGAVLVQLYLMRSVNDDYGSGDYLSGIEKVIGSGYADFLQGDDNTNIFIGGRGNDTVLGEGGIDTIDYSTALAGVNVNLFRERGIANDGEGGSDTLRSIEIVIGSTFGDTLEGTAFEETLVGGSGNDFLYGGPHGDSFVFQSGSGIDTIVDFSSAFDPFVWPFAQHGDTINLQSNLNNSGITTGAEALARTVDSGGNAIVDLGGGNSITLLGVTTASLAASDFVIF